MKAYNNKNFLDPVLWTSNILGLIFIDKYSIIFWISNMIINIAIIYMSYIYIQNKITGDFNNCFKKNFCSDVVESVNRIIQPTGTLFLALFNCRTLKKDTISQIQNYLAHNILYHSWIHKYFVLIFIFIYAIISCFNLCIQSFLDVFLFFINSGGFLVIDILVLTLCYTIEKSFEDINDKLEIMIKINYVDLKQMNLIINQHWNLCKLLNDVNNCFGADLVIRMLYTVIRITMLLFTIIEYHSADELGKYAMLVLAEHTFEVFIFAFKIFYICYRGSKLTNEGKRTLIIIREINLKMNNSIRKYITQSLDIFTIRVNCQPILLSASGFVEINLQLIQSLVGLILTYWIVLAQFQGDQETTKTTR